VRALAILILCSSACGRGGFDNVLVPDAPPPAIDAMPDAPPVVLACTGQRFSIPATTGMKLSAAATARGFDVFTVDDAAGQVQGYAYNFAGDNLAAGAHAVPIAPDATGPLAPLAVGDDILMIMPYGRPKSTGTSLLALDAQLGTKHAAMIEGFSGDLGALTRNDRGSIALITQRLDTDPNNPWQVTAQLISPDGANITEPAGVINGSETAFNQMILPAKNGFLLSWASASHVRAELLDPQLSITTPEPIVISPETVEAKSSRTAYLASADRYLFVWYIKVSGSDDQVWASLRDADLAELGGGPILLSGTSTASFPVVVASRDDFLVAWQTDTGALVGAARVTKDGSVIQPDIRTNGGTAIAWDLVVRNGQAALVWLETAGTGANLRLDPICNQ
jgi:hypothetical protein